MVRAKRFVFAKEFEGLPKISDFRLEEFDLPKLDEGDILGEAVFLSVDPYMRGAIGRTSIGTLMTGSQVAKVIETKNKKYKVGDFITGCFGWTTHTVCNPDKREGDLIPTYILPDFEGLSHSLALGIVGMPGVTSYYGFLEICRPMPGEVLVVSGAAGACGSYVGQIAKLQGLTVIGICGGKEKCDWIVNELGFDYAINYKEENAVEKKLPLYAPKGVDCYYDNVGGEISISVIKNMALRGRIAVCGSISSYNSDGGNHPVSMMLQPLFIYKQLKMEGFVVTRFWNQEPNGAKWLRAMNQLKRWVLDGKLIYRETLTTGFENLPQAFIDMLQGKAMVKV